MAARRRSSFPRRHARTRGFTLGRPRGFQVGADGARVAFLRSGGGDDPVNRLWVLELASGAERLVADPAALLGDGADDLPPEERARRERARERAGGIVAFAADLDLTVASFALAGRLFLADLRGSGEVRELAAGDGVLDPRVDPTGTRVAWVAGRALHVGRARRGWHPGRPAAGRRGRPGGELGAGRVPGRRGDGPVPGVLVVAGLASGWPWPGSTCAGCGGST